MRPDAACRFPPRVSWSSANVTTFCVACSTACLFASAFFVFPSSPAELDRSCLSAACSDCRHWTSSPCRVSTSVTFLAMAAVSCFTDVARLTTGIFAAAAAPPTENGPGFASEDAIAAACPAVPRSEEHTSELQSRPHLVCRLLLEKKKKKKKCNHKKKKKKKKKKQ